MLMMTFYLNMCEYISVTVYFKVSLLQCIFKYWVILINYVLTIWLGLGLGFGLGLLACNYASFIVITTVSTCDFHLI